MMLETGNQHVYLTAGQTWTAPAKSDKTETHLDVLEESQLILTCNWEDNLGVRFVNKSITLPSFRYDMQIKSITVTSGRVHIAKV